MQQLVKRSFVWKWLLAICFLVTTASCEDGYQDPFDNEAQMAWEEEVIKDYLTKNNITNYTRTQSGLYYVKLEDGAGDKPTAGKIVEVNYIGRFIEGGRKFDSSYDRAQTFKFTLGQRQVISGWDEGVALMQRGEKALLLIPSRMAYGRTGSSNGAIPPNTPLMFEVHLINF